MKKLKKEAFDRRKVLLNDIVKETKESVKDMRKNVIFKPFPCKFTI